MNDFISYPIQFDTNGLINEISKCIDIAFDQLSMVMQKVICDVISQCSEAANVMILEAQKNVQELSRNVKGPECWLEVGIDENNIKGGEQGFVRVMVTLHGNGEVWAVPGAEAWTKHVNTKRRNNVQVKYRLDFFEQQDHSGTMMLAFEHDMNKHIKQFENSLWAMLEAIDYSKYLS